MKDFIQERLAWCEYEREISQSIVDDIDQGAVHRTGPVGGPLRDVTQEIRAREASTVDYLESFIRQLTA